jgi:hypothetical protein
VTALDEDLFALRDAEIQRRNTPVFFAQELTVERVSQDSQLDKVLNWWRCDVVWIPRERNHGGCACDVVLADRQRVLDLREHIVRCADL